jgi:5-carboxymethyl-2-hydroxymuconate isomerase
MTRVASFRRLDSGETGFGLIDGDSLVDSSNAGATTLVAAMREGALADLAPSRGARRHALAEILLMPPVAAPEKIICVGVNYAQRNEEYRDGSTVPEHPSLFVRFPGSFVGHDQAIVRPRESEQLDYEGEIVLVIGRDGRHVGRDRAIDHIGGLTLANEGTVRDWLRHSKFNVTQGKNFDSSGSIGPWIVPTAEIDISQPLELTTRVNGETRQKDSTASMMFDFGRLIEYISRFTTLRVGDLILTGTPAGAGARSRPPRWLKPGDVVEVEVPEIGTLRNTVIDA